MVTNNERFWSKVNKKTDDECWEWLAAINKSGRGSFSLSKTIKVQAHRYAYELTYSSPGLQHVLHICDNPICCNPKHLFLGTHRNNMEDMARKNRNKTSRPGNGVTKIPISEHPNIMKLIEEENTISSIARKYGVTPTNIRYIAKKYGYKSKNN